MAQAPKRQRFLNWTKRHKVLSVFLVLAGMVLVYMAIDMVVWNVQIHAEKERYTRMQQALRHLSQKQTYPMVGSLDSFADCSYSHDGAVFSNKTSSCEVGSKGTYRVKSYQDAVQFNLQTAQNLKAVGFNPSENKSAMDEGDIDVYVFDRYGLPCALVNTYKVLKEDGPTVVSEVDCSYKTKSVYFPVIDG